MSRFASWIFCTLKNFCWTSWSNLRQVNCWTYQSSRSSTARGDSGTAAARAASRTARCSGSWNTTGSPRTPATDATSLRSARTHGQPPYTSGRASFWRDAYSYASGRREICVQKFRNAYQRKEIEKRMTHFKSTLSPGSSNENVRKRCALSFHNSGVFSVIVRLVCSLRRVETFCVRCTHRLHVFVVKRWKNWFELGENLSLIKFKSTRSNSSQVDDQTIWTPSKLKIWLELAWLGRIVWPGLCTQSFNYYTQSYKLALNKDCGLFSLYVRKDIVILKTSRVAPNWKRTWRSPRATEPNWRWLWRFTGQSASWSTRSPKASSSTAPASTTTPNAVSGHQLFRITKV